MTFWDSSEKVGKPVNRTSSSVKWKGGILSSRNGSNILLEAWDRSMSMSWYILHQDLDTFTIIYNWLVNTSWYFLGSQQALPWRWMGHSVAHAPSLNQPIHNHVKVSYCFFFFFPPPLPMLLGRYSTYRPGRLLIVFLTWKNLQKTNKQHLLLVWGFPKKQS